MGNDQYVVKHYKYLNVFIIIISFQNIVVGVGDGEFYF